MSGNEVKIKREFLGLTQKQLAERVGITRQTIAKIETGYLDDDYDNPIKRVIDYELGKAFIDTSLESLTIKYILAMNGVKI